MITSFLTRYLLIPAASAGEPLKFSIPNPLGDQKIDDIISRLFTALVYLAAFIAPIFIIYGAFQILTAGGSTEKFETGKKTILYTVLGFLIVLMAKGIVEIVKSVLKI